MNTRFSFRDAVALLFRFLLLVKDYWGRLATNLALGSIIGLIGLVPPLLTRQFIDGVYPSHDISLLALLVASVTASITASAALSTFRGYYSQRVSGELSVVLSLFFSTIFSTYLRDSSTNTESARLVVDWQMFVGRLQPSRGCVPRLVEIRASA